MKYDSYPGIASVMPATCNNLRVKGIYSAQAAGIVAWTGQIAVVGQITLNGKGALNWERDLGTEIVLIQTDATSIVTGSFQL